MSSTIFPLFSCHPVCYLHLYVLSLLSASYLEEVFEVRLVVNSSLEQCGSVDLAGAEADVGLHVGQLRGQDIPDHLHRHVLPAHLLTNTQRPAHM